MAWSNSPPRSNSSHSCISNTLNDDSELCPDISSRTDSLLWDLEHNVHDGASVKDFVQHVFHVKSEHIDAILSGEWHPNPEELRRYQATLGSSASQSMMDSAFANLVDELARRVSITLGAKFSSETLSNHLESTFLLTSAPEIISMPPPDTLFVDLVDGGPEDSGVGLGPRNWDVSVSKKPHNPTRSPLPVTSADLHLIAHAVEAMQAPGRHYTSCTSINSFSVTLWYYDRTCMVRTIEFDLRHQTKEFALFAYAISHDPGHIPYAHINQVKNPQPDPQLGLTSTGVQIFVRLDVPQSLDAKFTILEPIYTYYALIGRGTMVYTVTLDHSDGVFADDQVLKLSWPPTVRPRETMFIETIVAAAPEWQAHIPEVTFSATFTADQLLPRLNLLKAFSSKAFEDRYLHIMSMGKYKKLWEVDNIEEFQDAFVDCVECHHYSYHKGRVLHRDLSENNVMFKRHRNRVKGILNDWDMASLVDENGEVPPSAASYATGTIPFMAYDLLGTGPPAHLYRHDLESFMYILIWAAVHYDFAAKQKLPIDSCLAGWNNKNRHLARQAKSTFLFEPSGTSAIFQRVREDFQPILKRWIMPLHALFSGAIIAGSTTDIRTYGGQITFETFMGVLGRKPR